MNNPFLYHPHPLCKLAADDICLRIEQNPAWQAAFSQGKMLGVLVYSRVPFKYIAAYSGVVDIDDSEGFFVPPIYGLQHPDDFYKQGEAEISAINRQVETSTDTAEVERLKVLRREKSLALQLKIFSRFNIINRHGQYRNIVEIFSAAKRGLPPGGTGECCAPRLLQYYYQHLAEDLSSSDQQQGRDQLLLAEFWYGQSPRKEAKVHRAFYPSCIEKCSPLLDYMLDGSYKNRLPLSAGSSSPLSSGNGLPSSSTLTPSLLPDILYEDEHIIVVNKPSGLLSTPAKDLTQPNVETWLHERYPLVKGPMLAHRLDQGTSGLLIAAKDAATHKHLQQLFENKGKAPSTASLANSTNINVSDSTMRTATVPSPIATSSSCSKRYIALLIGSLPSDCGILHLPMCPNPDDRPRQVIDHHFGKSAITRYEVLRRLSWQDLQGQHSLTLVAFYPITGRTHQLRLHAASPEGLAHPIVGDTLYLLPDHPIYGERSLPDGLPADRLLLHAESLTIDGHIFNSPCPFLPL